MMKAHDVSAAARLARRLVAPLGRRWVHVQAVAARADGLRTAVREQDGDTLVAAAWLPDIGYAQSIATRRFHPLDGARYLRDAGWPAAVVNLVAHHSGARFEAEQRGLTRELSRFPLDESEVLDALVTADLTTGPSGERLTYAERVAEILRRYPPHDPVHRAWQFAAPIMVDSVIRTRVRAARAALLEAHQSVTSPGQFIAACPTGQHPDRAQQLRT